MFIPFTEFVSDPFTKYEAGWYSIGLFMVFLTINTAVVLRDSFKHTNLVRIKYTAICKAYYDQYSSKTEAKDDELIDSTNIFEPRIEKIKILTKDNLDCDVNILI